MQTIQLSNLAPKLCRNNNNEVVDDGGGIANETVVNLYKNNKSRNLIYMPNIGVMEKLYCLILDPKKTFNYLRSVFIKVPIP